MLVQRVGAVADRAEAVECRDAERAGEIAVRAAAGAALFQRHADLRRNAPGLLEQHHHRRCAFERRAIESAFHFDLRARCERRQRTHRALHAIRIRARDGARIDRRARLGRNDVRARAARDHANGQRDAVGGILQIVDRE